jgi:cycloeucalenol cycloisomerase
MYPLTHAYFMTYFAALMVVERWIGERLRLGVLWQVVVVIGLSYGMAFLETWVMASPLLEGLFRYESRERMLRLGSLGYASYFVVGLPMVKRVDRGERWTLERVVVEAFASCMMILVLLEVWAKVAGPL